MAQRGTAAMIRGLGRGYHILLDDAFKKNIPSQSELNHRIRGDDGGHEYQNQEQGFQSALVLPYLGGSIIKQRYVAHHRHYQPQLVAIVDSRKSPDSHKEQGQQQEQVQ